MILANNLSAQYAAQNNIPFIFRSQPPSEPNDIDLSTIPVGPAQDFAKRVGLTRSVTSTTPLPHATLGLDAYAQTSSPIRRYADLINQRQLCAQLAGETLPYTQESIKETLHTLETPLVISRNVARDTKKYWLLTFLRQMQKRKETINGTIIRLDGRFPIVELDTIYMLSLIHI